MYHAHAANILCMLYIFVVKKMWGTNAYVYSESSFLTLLPLLHHAPLMIVFTAVGYLVFKALLKRVIEYRLASII